MCLTISGPDYAPVVSDVQLDGDKGGVLTVGARVGSVYLPTQSFKCIPVISDVQLDGGKGGGLGALGGGLIVQVPWVLAVADVLAQNGVFPLDRGYAPQHLDLLVSDVIGSQ